MAPAEGDREEHTSSSIELPTSGIEDGICDLMALVYEMRHLLDKRMLSPSPVVYE